MLDRQAAACAFMLYSGKFKLMRARFTFLIWHKVPRGTQVESIGEFALLQLTLAARRVAQGDSSVAAAVTDHLASSLFLRVYFGRAGGRSSQRKGSGAPAFVFCFSSEEMRG